MWVRSQDKELLMECTGFNLVTGISQIELQCRINCTDNLNSAIMGKSGNTLYYLGIYGTKTEAVKLLDYIQDKMSDYQHANENQKMFVLKMPEY